MERLETETGGKRQGRDLGNFGRVAAFEVSWRLTSNLGKGRGRNLLPVVTTPGSLKVSRTVGI